MTTERLGAFHLAALVEPELDVFTFTFDVLRSELEKIEAGAGARGWDVLEHLPPAWATLGWRILYFEVEANR